MPIKKTELTEDIKDKFKSSGLQTKQPMTQHIFRMKENDYQELKRHFDDKGLSVGAGIRSILYEYMDNNNLR